MRTDPQSWFHKPGGARKTPHPGSRNRPCKRPAPAWRSRLAFGAILAVAALVGAGARTASPALAAGEPFRTGDLFQSGGGYIVHINPAFGIIGSWVPSDGEGPTSMAIDADGNLYASVIAGGVVVITSEGFYGGLVVDDEDAGAITVDGDGNIFVAVPSATIRKYDPGGSLVDSYTVATGSGSTQATSLAMAGDDCTLFYTNDDTVVRRYNVCTETQLSNFGSGITSAQVVRLTPGGDVLVSDADVIHLFDADTGNELETYGTPSSGVWWKSMAVEPDGEHFWAVNGDDEDFHRFDVDTADETNEGSASMGEGGTGNDLVIYTGPVVLPDETISYYVGDLDTNSSEVNSKPFKWGCEVRRHHRYGAIILFFGQAWNETDPVTFETLYGTNLPDTENFETSASIEIAVERFIKGYAGYDPPGPPTHTCISPSEPELPYLRLVVATSNFGLGSTNENTNGAHGAAWAQMINDIADWIYNVAEVGDIVEVVGGIDAEVDFNTGAHTLDWVAGYGNIANWSFYDVGDAGGCPAEGTSSTPGWCNTEHQVEEWTQDDVWNLSWGNSLAWPFPIVYLNDGSQAAQWQQLSLYGVLNSFSAMAFRGSLTQSHACTERQNCTTDDNTSDEGYIQLKEAVNGTPETLSYIPWRSDVSWIWKDSSPPAVDQ